MINILDRYLTENKESKTLPLIYPIIFFNGTENYNVPRNLWDLFTFLELAREFWTKDYRLVNVHEIPDEELKKRVWSGILQFFMKHIHERQLLTRWQEVADLLPEIIKVSIGYNYLEMLLRYTLTKIDASDRVELGKLLTSKLNEKTGTELMGSLAHHWEQIGEERGIKFGEARGIQLGEARGEAKLVKVMNKNGCSVEEISKMTQLPINKINELLKIHDNNLES